MTEAETHGPRQGRYVETPLSAECEELQQSGRKGIRRRRGSVSRRRELEGDKVFFPRDELLL